MRLTRPSYEFSPEAGLTRWYRTRSLGRRLVDQLTAQLSKDLEHIFGYYTVVTGPDIGLPFSQLGKRSGCFGSTVTSPPPRLRKRGGGG